MDREILYWFTRISQLCTNASSKECLAMPNHYKSSHVVRVVDAFNFQTAHRVRSALH